MKMSVNDKKSIVKNNWLFPIVLDDETYNVGEDVHISKVIKNYVYFLKIQEGDELEKELMEKFDLNLDVAKNVKNKIIVSLVKGLMECLDLLEDSERDIIVKGFEHRLICIGYETRREALFNKVYTDSKYFEDFLDIKKSYKNECNLYRILTRIDNDSITNINNNNNINDCSLLFLKECRKKGWSFTGVNVPDIKKLYYHNTGSEFFIAEVLSNCLKLNQLDSLILLDEEATERLNSVKEFGKPAFKQLHDAIMEGNIELDYLDLSVFDLDLILLTTDMSFEDTKECVQSLINKLYTSKNYFPGMKIIEDMLSLFYIGEYSFFNDIPKFKDGLTGSYIKHREDDENYYLEISKHKIMIMENLSLKRVYGKNGITSFFEVLEGVDITSPINIYFESKPSIFTSESIYNTKSNVIERVNADLKDGYVNINNEILNSANKEGIELSVKDDISLLTFKSNTIEGINLVKEVYEIILQEGLRFSQDKKEVEELRQRIDEIALKSGMSLMIENRGIRKPKKTRKF